MGFDGFPIEFHFLLGCEKQAESNPTSKNERKDCLSPTLEKFNFNYQGFSRKREMFEVSRCSLQKKKKFMEFFTPRHYTFASIFECFSRNCFSETAEECRLSVCKNVAHTIVHELCCFCH